MLKFGVVERRDLRRPRTLFGRRRHVSFLLLRELAQARDVDPEEYDRLVGFAPMPNGIWKRTRQGRLRILDESVMALVHGRFRPDAKLIVADVAASTGVTSVEFFDVLRQSFDVDFIATDLYRDLVAVWHRRWRLGTVFDPEGRAVQYVWGRFVIPASLRESPAYPVNHAVKALITQRFVPAAQNALRQTDVHALAAFDEYHVGEWDVIRLPMLSKSALQAVQINQGFQFQVADVLQPFPARAHIVRAMNIITEDHFSDVLRRRVLANCIQAVLPGGLFIVGWSPTPDPTTVEATVYAVHNGVLTVALQLNGGSEIDRMIAATFPVRSAA